MKKYKTNNPLLLKLFKDRDDNYLTKDFKDYHSESDIVYCEMDSSSLIACIINFLINGSELIYPAKSYFVALIYAIKLYCITNEDVFEILKEENLLLEDKYFKPFDDLSKEIYYKSSLIFNILKNSREEILNSKGALQVLEYFYEEFGEQYRCN